jgi:spore coat protein U-like protein
MRGSINLGEGGREFGQACGDIALTAFGRIDAGQFVPAGVYGDTVTVTVTY